MFRVDTTKGFSLMGVLAAVILVGSLFALLYSTGAGLLGILVAVLIATFGRGKDHELVCPLCKHRITL